MADQLIRHAVCPQCFGWDELITIESLEGYAGVEATLIGDEVVFDWSGETDVNWDSTTTIGIECNACGWSYSGVDWATALILEPLEETFED